MAVLDNAVSLSPGGGPHRKYHGVDKCVLIPTVQGRKMKPKFLPKSSDLVEGGIS